MIEYIVYIYIQERERKRELLTKTAEVYNLFSLPREKDLSVTRGFCYFIATFFLHNTQFKTAILKAQTRHMRK